ncbi:unnamed protein product [Cuscuta campestris]|uniref:Uncharacterized protein n=1 Tax=Cuscuta campestris TaxID=132261 RepID=A0A484LRF2_9ASTE|nr:unnamed protein product [Cuscuta campestris]
MIDNSQLVMTEMQEKGESRGRRQDGGKGRARTKVQLNLGNSGGILVLVGGLMATVILSSVFRRRRKPVDEVDNTPEEAEEDGGAEADGIGDDEDLPKNSAQLILPDSSPLTHHQQHVNLRDNQTDMQASNDEELESPASGVHATIPEDQESPPNATGDLIETKFDVSAAKDEMEITCCVDNDDDGQKKSTYPAIILDDLTTNNVVKTQDLDSIHDPKDGVAIHGLMRLQEHNVKEEEEEEVIMEAINGGDKQQKNYSDECMKMKNYILDRLFTTTFGSERRMAIAGIVALTAVMCSCFSCLFGTSFLKYCIALLPCLASMAFFSNFNKF